MFGLSREYIDLNPTSLDALKAALVSYDNDNSILDKIQVGDGVVYGLNDLGLIQNTADINLNMNLGNIHRVTLDATSNVRLFVPNNGGTSSVLILQVVNGGLAAGVVWHEDYRVAGGMVTLSASGMDQFVFVSDSAGVWWGHGSDVKQFTNKFLSDDPPPM